MSELNEFSRAELLLGEGDPGGKEQEQPRRRTQGHDVPPFPAGNRSRSCSSTFRMPWTYSNER